MAIIDREEYNRIQQETTLLSLLVLLLLIHYIGSNATGVISYKTIANEVDILLISCDHKSKINVEMNRLGKYASKIIFF